ncbi:hypothetical protein E1263_27555 [Kribbella antibiotica]|uniref:GAF domain-containing protein n=1 Tax=Kribbella antibiotica TaxID=190195 RepID=A0A4R4Z6U1_9ACTN|nr:hypothetical protein [Kribbella antibiotica]TDD53853.1 hypothetical protein E1263_27555 [Kribbella antibiotica]
MLEFNGRRRSDVLDVRPWYCRLSWWRLALWSVVAAAGLGAWALQVDYGETLPGQTGWWIFSGDRKTIIRNLGMLCAALIVAVPAFMAWESSEQAKRAGRREEAAVAYRIQTVNGVIAPLSYFLGSLAQLDPGETLLRQRLAGGAQTATLAGLANLHGGWDEGVRVCLYLLEGDKQKRRLVFKDHSGRGHRKPMAVVYEDDGGRGTETFKALDAREPRTWRYVKGKATPAGWNLCKKYRSFMAVPVAMGDALFGMISIDAEDPAAFHVAVDLPTLQTVASLYAAFLAGVSAPKDHPDRSGSTFV